MTKVYQKSFYIYQDCRNEGVMMITFKEVLDRVGSTENQFFNINSSKWPSVHFLSEKFNLVLKSYWRVITYLFFHPVNALSKWRHQKIKIGDG